MRAAVTLLGVAVGIEVFAGRAAAQPADSRALAAAEEFERVVTGVIESCAPSVVAIAQDRRRRGGDRPLPFDLDPAALRRISPLSSDFVPTYFGSGVVVDAAGLVLTNYHVLGFDNEDYEVDHYVTTADRKVYRARIKAADPRSDLAILELVLPDGLAASGLTLKPMLLGDGSAARRGTMVIALGNPYAIARDGQASASWGIVANVDRKLPASADEDVAAQGKTTLHHYGGLIQSDARLNLGTSGGALVNLRGEMIGLTTAVAAQVGYETSAGFAIAVDDVFRRALESLKAGREVEYGFLGVQPAPAEADLLGGAPTSATGVRVERVVRGGPGERAGLQRDDRVTAIDGAPIATADDLVLGISRLPPEANVRLSVIRAGRASELTAELTKARVVGRRVVTDRPSAWRGLRVEWPAAIVPPQELIEIPTGCVAVRSIAAQSPAARAGLAAGMLISRVGDRDVSTLAAFRDAVATHTGPVELTIRTPEGEPRRLIVAEE